MSGENDELLKALAGADVADLAELIEDLPDSALPALLEASAPHVGAPVTPAAQAADLDEGYVPRAHLAHLSHRLARAVRDVEKGKSRYVLVAMPPRMGKSRHTSIDLPLWLLRKHPDWSIGLISHSPDLASAWGLAVRRMVEEHGGQLGLQIAKDAGAVMGWQTTAGGGVISRSAPGQTVTGRGFKALLIDDVVRDFASAHNKRARDAIWSWWSGDAYPRLEHPALVVVTATRWHEDDLTGRLLSREYAGDPDDWDRIILPAIAEQDDVLGRQIGDPLYSPLVAKETRQEALERWEMIREAVGPDAWASLYQQRPVRARGAIFDPEWWRYWTTDPSQVREDGTVVLLDEARVRHGEWLDSWDAAFKATDDSDYVVGQRWVKAGADRFLIAQQRGRFTFTQTLERLRTWAQRGEHLHDPSPFGRYVHVRAIEDKANGPAIIDVLRSEIAGLRPIATPVGKEARARAITPEVRSGNVYLPHPLMPGYEWVNELGSELREFPRGAHDDQVDALTQALRELRDAGMGHVSVPGGPSARAPRRIDRNVSQAAATTRRPPTLPRR